MKNDDENPEMEKNAMKFFRPHKFIANIDFFVNINFKLKRNETGNPELLRFVDIYQQTVVNSC